MNKQARHTPWPWFQSVDRAREVRSSTGRLVADCSTIIAGRGLEEEANARLIAEAPAMEGALRDAMARGYFDAHPNDSEGEADEKANVRAILARING